MRAQRQQEDIQQTLLELACGFNNVTIQGANDLHKVVKTIQQARAIVDFVKDVQKTIEDMPEQAIIKFTTYGAQLKADVTVKKFNEKSDNMTNICTKYVSAEKILDRTKSIGFMDELYDATHPRPQF